MNQQLLREKILSQIKIPEISNTCYKASDFGIESDSTQIQTNKIQTAISTISAQGGGRLTLPKGTYYTGAIHLKSGVDLHLENEETILKFVPIPTFQHYPLVFCHWEASPCYNFSPLVYAFEEENIALTGKGILDGGASKDHWWNWHHQVEEAWSENKTDLQLEDRNAHRKMNQNGTPVAERIFGEGHYLRPNFFQTIKCKQILLQGVTFKNSPMWQLNPVLCQSLTIDGVTLSSHGSNNDGCDPESCSGIHIKNCYFDTGDDCISLKSGRDRDGRKANIPCEYVLIENNNFADGHGGIALGSEMSGGIRYVLASNNIFASPNLTYALRLKTNAKRGGTISDIALTNSVMTNVNGAAVHGTMLYEDGRNGDNLPMFKNITIENIKASGGDYGIFLEAFEEVPITGLVLKNIEITGVGKALRSMNWQNPVIENVKINGKTFTRPTLVRIKGVPLKGNTLIASASSCDNHDDFKFTWLAKNKDSKWKEIACSATLIVPENVEYLKILAEDKNLNIEESIEYSILQCNDGSEAFKRLKARGMITEKFKDLNKPVTRLQIAKMLIRLAEDKTEKHLPKDTSDNVAITAIANEFFSLDKDGKFNPNKTIKNQEMATVAMQSCGVNYRNASSTMPVCDDVKSIDNNYGTNVARALYFGFMQLDNNNCFNPLDIVTIENAIEIINKVADFAGI